MAKIILLLGIALTAASTFLTWASINMVGMHEIYNGFSREEIFGNKPGIKTLVLLVLILIFSLIPRKIPRYIALALSVLLIGWGLYQLYDKWKYITIVADLNPGIYLHALAPILLVSAAWLSIKRAAKR